MKRTWKLLLVLTLFVVCSLLMFISRSGTCLYSTGVQPLSTTSAGSVAIATTQSAVIKATDHEETWDEDPIATKRDPPSGPRRRGYIFAMKFWEQQTFGVRNFLQLQCLGHKLGLRTVEPFLNQSTLTLPFELLLKGKNVLTLGDLIDMEHWNKHIGETYGYDPVADWNTFLVKAPRELILPCIMYRNPNNVRVPVPQFEYANGCPKSCSKYFHTVEQFLEQYGFKVIRRPCFNFVDFAGTIPEKVFARGLLGTRENKNVTVLFLSFRGFFGLYRLPILSPCGITHYNAADIDVRTSPRIMSDVHKYLSDVVKGDRFIGILIRVEKMFLHNLNFTQCAAKLEQVLSDLHSQRPGETKHFLGMDVGRFGTKGSSWRDILDYGKLMFKSVFKDSWTFDEWDKSLEKHVSSTNEAYVASFQRTIVSRSTCLIEVGGGGFQNLAEQYYKEFHPREEEWCIRQMCG